MLSSETFHAKAPQQDSYLSLVYPRKVKSRTKERDAHNDKVAGTEEEGHMYGILSA